MKSRKIAILAYSGGLDTSYCAKYLTEEQGMEVYSILVNTGGFNQNELNEIERRAYLLGIRRHKVVDITKEYYQKCLKYLIYGNTLKNNTYPLSVSSERTFQAIHIAEFAKTMKADFIVHGSTGAGNDQIRFDMAFQIVAPDIEVITPIRDLKISRKEEIEYLEEKGVCKNWDNAEYSINKGIWGTSIGGRETLTSHEELPEKAYNNHLKNTTEEKLTIGFVQGELNSMNGVNNDPVNIIKKINQLGEKYAIGRDIHTGDTILGTKGRVAFEAPAPLMIIKAHHALEKHTLTKWQMHWKDQLANWYGMFLHESLYFEPVMRNIEKFLMDSQKSVTGTIEIKLNPYRFNIIGIKSPNDLMQSNICDYGEMNKAWDGNDVKGFTKIMSNSINTYSKVNNLEY